MYALYSMRIIWWYLPTADRILLYLIVSFVCTVYATRGFPGTKKTATLGDGSRRRSDRRKSERYVMYYDVIMLYVRAHAVQYNNII